MKVIETLTLYNKSSLNHFRNIPLKRTSINLLSFQRSFASISYPCKLSSGFLKALAETRKRKYSHRKLKVCL
ncbi:hypothetical protein ACEWYD_07855, partial [Helicobacter pylori]